MVAGGADILEIQLAFSDPSADGPAIQGACTKVLERGYKTADGLSLIKKIRGEFPQTTIYLMSYGSLVFTPGVKEFCKRAAASGGFGISKGEQAKALAPYVEAVVAGSVFVRTINAALPGLARPFSRRASAVNFIAC